jgi:hypothetical protein
MNENVKYLRHTKKVNIELFTRARTLSQTSGSGSATLLSSVLPSANLNLGRDTVDPILKARRFAYTGLNFNYFIHD